MPRYGYYCNRCQSQFDLVRPMRESGDAGACPEGHPDGRRTFAPVVTLGPVGERPSIEEIHAEHHLAEHGHGHAH